MYTLVVTPDQRLIQTTKPVTHFDSKLHNVLKEMEETLRATTDPVGVGLAAPQVGVMLRIFQMKPTAKAAVSNFINPEIVEKSSSESVPNFTNSKKVESKKPKKGKLLEGCLSIPNIWGNVSRKKTVLLSWQDEKGKQHEKLFTGFPAIIVQHEMDHLNGVLFTKHVVSQGEKLYKSHKDENGEDVFDEIKI